MPLQAHRRRASTASATESLITDAEARATDIAAARAVFEQLVALEAAYDPAAAALYGADGVVIEQTLMDGVARPAREIPMRRYKAALPFMLSLSKKAGEQARHDQIETEWLSPGWVRIRTQRHSSQSRSVTAYEITLRRENDGCWRVAKEVATLAK
jgi:pterin-4a-carbinolamine dehydratase